MAIGNLTAIFSKMPSGTPPHSRLYDSLLNVSSNSASLIQFATLPQGTPAQTSLTGTGDMATITIDMSQIPGIMELTIDLAHEGVHESDLFDINHGGETLITSPFQLEYRAYEMSAWVAQDIPVATLGYMHNSIIIWDSSWPTGSVAALMDQAITKLIPATHPGDSSYAEVQPHDPYPGG